MSMLVNPHRFGSASLLAIVQRLGLDANLKLCLDAGDIVSYPGSGQQWIDRSSAANNFYLGSSGSASGDDPTFNGTAGALSPSEYFLLNGSQDFRSTADLTWADDWTQTNAKYTMAFFFQTVDIGGAPRALGQFASMVPLVLNTELIYHADAGGSMGFSSAGAITPDLPALAIISGDEAGGASASFISVNGVVTTGDSVMAGGSYPGSSSVYSVGGNQGGGQRMPNNTRYWGVLAWDGTNLNTTQAGQLYSAIKALRAPTMP